MEISKNKLVAVGGPTATGKSEIAVKLAQLIDGEIINADSVQVYKYMDIGSNKDQIDKTGEHLEGELADGSEVEIDAFKIKGTQVKGWLFDLVTPDVNFTVADYQLLADKVISDIRSRGKAPILVGGTGLYIDAVIKGYQVESEPDMVLRKELNTLSVNQLQSRLTELGYNLAKLNNSDLNNPRRLIRLIEKQRRNHEQNKPLKSSKYDVLFLYPTFDRENLMQKIEERVNSMIELGLIDEVKRLLEKGYSIENKALQSTGYKQVIEFLSGKIEDKQALTEAIITAHKQYAKRQITWFEGSGRGYKLERIDKFALSV